MVKSCCAVGCTNRHQKGSGLSFYRFPVASDRRSQWIAAVRRENWQPNEYSWVCSAHFVSGKKSDDPLSPDYVPSLFNHVKSPQKRRVKRQLERYEQRKSTKKRRLDVIEDISSSHSELEQGDSQQGDSRQGIGEENETQIPHTADSSTMTDMSARYISALEEECLQVTGEKRELKSNVPWSENALQFDEQKVKFYTGLPSFSILMIIYNFVSAQVHYGTKARALSKFEEFISTVLKLRLGLYDQDLAYRFGVHQTTISRNFRRWIDIMFTRLKPLIKWPGREELQKTMPLDFKAHFKKCVVIIDCFEIFCERPKPLKARAQTYSSYKHHNTVKYLIGIAPQGVITFISKGWGGRASDQHITENSGFLDLLLPGDQVLADRGFNIQESAGLYCAEVKLPPFTRGKKQLDKVDVDFARQLSRVRIHVERVIGLLRQKYTILESTLPINMIMCPENSDISLIDKIVTVCCALCNCCESVIPFQ